MSVENSSLSGIITSDEEILWQGKSGTKTIHYWILAVATLIAAALFWLSWSDTSPAVKLAPLLAHVVGTAIFLVPASFSVLMLLSVTNSAETVFTTKRIFNINRLGGVSPMAGFPLDFHRKCKFEHLPKTSELDVPTAKLESGYPEWYSIAGLEKDTVIALIDAFERLCAEDTQVGGTMEKSPTKQDNCQ